MTEEVDSLRPRSDYTGYKAFGTGDGAVLVEPEVVRELRHAAEFADEGKRVTGGLLFGRRWTDDQGTYLVVSGFLPVVAADDQPDSPRDFALPEDDLRLLRQQAATMYSESGELGWWRTLPELGEFGPGDMATQAELVDPYGVGLLVYASGVHWGTAYLGPDGHAPDLVGTLVMAEDAVSQPPLEDGLDPGPDPVADDEPQLVDIAAGESLLQEPLLNEPLPGTDPGGGRPARGRTRQRMPSRAQGRSGVRVPPRVRAWAEAKASASHSGHERPADAQFVLAAMAFVGVAMAIIIGVLVHSLLVAIILVAVALLGVVWFAKASRR